MERQLSRVLRMARQFFVLLLSAVLALSILPPRAPAASGKSLVTYGMVPIRAEDVADGEYEVEIRSSSAFFKIRRATLVVSGGEMYARIFIGSSSYLYVYPGTNVEASRAPEADWIAGTAADSGTEFLIPVPALNAEFNCAAYSKRRKRWYARRLVVDASSLPESAFAFDLPDYELIDSAVKEYIEIHGAPEEAEEEAPASTVSEPVPMEVAYDDGEYSIEVNMLGGSGRASVSSPTLMIVRDGKAWAHLLWSSAYYDYMILDGYTYYNQTTDGGNSVFEIPITVMDEPIDVIADTTAMEDPLEIEYTLTFYSESVGSKSLIPQEAAKKVLWLSAAIIVLGGILNYFVKKKRK